MNRQHVPEEAIDAAVDLSYRGQQLTRNHAKHVLAAAMPHLTEDAPPRPTASTSAQIAALRNAVEQLAHNVGVSPAYRPPDRAWIESVSDNRYGEWDVQADRQERVLAVRAGADDGVDGVFLVDRRGDMHPLEVDHTYRLIGALSAALTYLQRNA